MESVLCGVEHRLGVPRCSSSPNSHPRTVGAQIGKQGHFLHAGRPGVSAIILSRAWSLVVLAIRGTGRCRSRALTRNFQTPPGFVLNLFLQPISAVLTSAFSLGTIMTSPNLIQQTQPTCWPLPAGNIVGRRRQSATPHPRQPGEILVCLLS